MIKRRSLILPGQREQSTPASVGGQKKMTERLESMPYLLTTRSPSPSSSGPRPRLLLSEQLVLTDSQKLPLSLARERDARLSTRGSSLDSKIKASARQGRRKKKKKGEKVRSSKFTNLLLLSTFRELRRSKLLFLNFVSRLSYTTTAT